MSDQKSAYEFKPENFAARTKALYDNWKSNKEAWKGADAIAIVNGETDEEIIYKKSTALQSWMFGMEMTDSVIILGEANIYILTGASTAEKLQFVKTTEVEGHDLAVHLIVSSGDNSEHFAQLLKAIQQSKGGANVGTLGRERALGDFAEAWTKVLEGSGITQVNVATAVANLFLVKDALELKFIRAAGRISATVLKDIALRDIEEIIDEEKKETHSAIAERIEDAFNEPTKINKSLTKDTVESCYTPIIQSGGVYDLKPSAISNDDNLHFGTIICSVGARFKHYCSNVARTYFVDPDEEKQKNYEILVDVFNLLVATLKPGVKLGKLYEVAKDHIQKTKPELEAHFLKTCGFGMGLEFRESALSLNNKNQKVAQAGMVFNLCIGFHNLETKGKVKDTKGKIYSMMLADTVIVTDGEAERPTKACPSKWTDVAYFLEDDEEEEEERKPTKRSSKGSRNDDADFGRRTTRSREQDKSKETAVAEEKRRKHQMELERKKREEAAARFREAESKGADKKGRKQGDYVSYTDPSQFPKDVKPGHIFVDVEKENVILPVHGLLVPFHISTIKSATQSEDFIRFNFITPISNFIGANKQPRVFNDAKAIFIKEMTYHCPDKKALTNSLRLIKEIRKRHLNRVEETQVREGLVKQEELILNKGRIPRLTDLYVRPNIGGRRTTGALEVHKNGFRFRSNKGGNIDILFKNIKHAFFQPADKELIVLVHFHLHDGIMIGKKKTQDIQVYTEVMEIAHNLDGRHRERDDMEDEHKERELRSKLNAEFKNFVKRVEELEPGLEFDIPYRDLGFHGVPGRTSCFLMPTVHCLVQLIEPPFFVLTLDEVEIAHFERVQFSLRNFDLVFVFKDLTRQPATISAIPVQSLDPIKEWLDECNIKYYEGPTSLNWKTLLSTIRADPKKFWEDGGWNFLNNDSSSDEELEDEGAEDAYNPSEQEDEDDAYEGSDDSAGEDDYEEEEDDESFDDDEEEEEDGEDWDELERKAEQADKRRGKFRDQEDKPIKKQKTNSGQARTSRSADAKGGSSRGGAGSSRTGEKRKRGF